jgi:hypothetical protein
MQLEQFIHKWRGSALKERQGYQEHFRDLCALFGHQYPSEADTQGDWFCFEYGVAKQGGGDGWADVFKKGSFGWEYKGKHKDLDAAYRQLLDYRVSLLNPPLLIVCDFDRFRVYTNFTNCENGCYEFDLAALPDKSALKPELTNFEVLRAVFESPEALRIGRDPLRITEDAAQSLGDIAIRMRKRGVDPLQAAHFVMKLVFCLFAESDKVGLLPNRPLKTLLYKSRNDFTRRMTNRWIAELIAKMDQGGEHHYDIIPQFDGGLFDGSAAVELENGEVKLLEVAAEFDWSRIEPSIFGTLLERSLDPQRQQQLGAHYTRPEEVMKVIEPVVLEPLREEWFDARAKLLTLAGPKHAKARRELIEGCLARLRTVRILDPACGSGNFLYLALRSVMDLEDEVRRFAHKEGIPILTLERAGPEILHGREIDEYAQQLASTVIWIGYIQKRLETGSYDERPILRPLENIILADSLLNPDGTRAVWQACDYIVGNPPFLGSKRMRDALGNAYVERLFAAYAGDVAREADLCCYFFDQARRQMELGLAQRAGLLATNSIRDTYSRGTLERINASTPVYNAWDDLEWVLDGANVRISIVGFGRPDACPTARMLNGELAPRINSDLTSGIDLTKAQRLPENKGLGFMGDKKNGSFELSTEEAQRMSKQRGNPHGKPNSDVIRPWLNGRSFLHPYTGKQFIIDFGIDTPLEEAAKYVAPFEYVEQHVKPERMTRDERYTLLREKWWIHGSPAFEMRRAVAGQNRILATPRVTHYRVFRFIEPAILPDCQLIVFAIDDWYRFGVLQSRVHELWSFAMGSELEDRPRYTPTTTFETFPFPRISPHLRERYPGGRASLPAPEAARAKARATNPVGRTAVSAMPGSAGYPAGINQEPPGKAAPDPVGPTAVSDINPAGGLKPAPPAAKRAKHGFAPPERAETPALPTATLPTAARQDADALIAAVEAAAQELYEMRDRVVFSGDPACDSYTALYKAMPAWLKNAHAKLDAAVLACYGLPPTASKHEILEFLLSENLARSG